jgi:uncharacterized membrane protein YphA (DoxX/SURF4 family)
MKKAPLIARILLGLMFFVFGLNGFLNFIPAPPVPENIQPFMNGLLSTHYFFPVLKGTETLCGAFLLSGAFVPLALIVLAPIIIQITLFHAFMEPSGLPLVGVIILLEVYLAFFSRPYSPTVKQIFRSRAVL